MSNIKLTYFDLSGRALPSRLAMIYAGIPFEDVRVQFNEWPALKASTPLGYLPVVEIDGVQHTQSSAIARHFARKADLYGKNDEEAFLIDQIFEIANEAFTFPKVEEARFEFIENVTKRNLKVLEAFYAKNGNGYAVASGISIADLYLFSTLTFGTCGFYTNVPDHETLLKDFPKVQKMVQTVRTYPKFVEYFAQHQKE